jgi:thiol-disulfide isomerase/thioredoxin
MKKLVLIAGLVLLVVIVAINTKPKAAIGDMPKFDLVRIAGGNFKSEDLHGKVAIVDFWASWCEPCKSEVPKYNKLADSLAGKEFQMIGYAVDSGTLDDVRQSAKELGIQYPVVMGTDAVTEGFGNYRGLPTTFLIGKDGKIYKKYEGTFAGKMEQISKDISQLLDIKYTPASSKDSKPIAQLQP